MRSHSVAGAAIGAEMSMEYGSHGGARACAMWIARSCAQHDVVKGDVISDVEYVIPPPSRMYRIRTGAHPGSPTRK